MQPPPRTTGHSPPNRDLRSAVPPLSLTREAASASFWMPVGLEILGLMLGVVAVGGVSVLTIGRSDGPAAVAVADRSGLNTTVAVASADGVTRDAAGNGNASDVATDAADRTAADAASAAVPDQAPADSKPAQTNAANAAPATEPDKPNNAVSARPLDDVRQRRNLLAIAGEGVGEDQLLLCRIPQVEPKLVQLDLFHREFEDAANTVLDFTRREQDQAVVWDVTQRAGKGLTRPEKPGSFSFDNGELRFRWNSGSDRSFLPFCSLRITVRGEPDQDSELCRLWKPFVVRDTRLTFAKAASNIDLLPPKTPLPPADCLRLEVDVENWPDHDFPDGKTIAPGKRVEVELTNPDRAGFPLLLMQWEFRVDRNQAQLQLASRTKMPRVRSRSTAVEIKDVDEPFAKADIARIKSDADKAAKFIEQAIERRLDPSIEQAQRQVTQLARQFAARPAIAKAEKELTDLQSQREKFDEALHTVKQVLDWTEAVARACANLEHDGRLRLRLVRKTREGDSLEILSTPMAANRE